MCGVDDISLDGLIHSVCGFRQSSARNSRLQKLRLEFHRCHVRVFNGFPVDQLDISCGQGLRKVIHCTGSLVCICTRYGSHIRHALDSHNSILKADAGIRELTDIGGHILERVNCLIGVGVQLLKILVDLLQRCAGAHHDRLNRAHLKLVFVKALFERLQCKRFDHPFSGIDDRVGNV